MKKMFSGEEGNAAYKEENFGLALKEFFIF